MARDVRVIASAHDISDRARGERTTSEHSDKPVGRDAAWWDPLYDAAQNDLTRASGIGAMERSRYVALRDFLLQYGGLTKSVDVDAVFTDRFVKDLYKDGRLVWR